MFYWRAEILSDVPGQPVVDVGFTGRSAQRGQHPYVGLNLGGHVGDDRDEVEANRGILASEFGVPRERLVFMNQVHGSTVVTVDGPWPSEPPEADGIVSGTTDLVLAVLVADCVPVLLYDAAAGVIGAVHAGRPGMTSGVVRTAVGHMRSLGATDVSAVVGPSICGRCYEVPEDMAQAAARVTPSSLTRSWTGTSAIDVAAGVVEQLSAESVALQWIPGCSREEHDLYSYRRDGVTGRFAGVITLRGGHD